MDNIVFNDTAEPVNIMDAQEFFEKAQFLLRKLSDAHCFAHRTQKLDDEQYPSQEVCDQCTGCGVFTLNGEDKECYVNDIEGVCFYRYTDYEEVGIEVENKLQEIYELLAVDLIKGVTNES